MILVVSKEVGNWKIGNSESGIEKANGKLAEEERVSKTTSKLAQSRSNV